MNSIKDRLNEIIEYKELTATKFAGLINANPSAISHLLKGRNRPGLEMLENIARTFPDISMDWLISGSGTITGGKGTDALSVENSSLRANQPVRQESSAPEKKSVVSEKTTEIPVSSTGKALKKVILFYTDGSFEEYRND